MEKTKISSMEIKKAIEGTLSRDFGVKFEEASKLQVYKAVCIVVRDLLTAKRVDWKKALKQTGAKQVFYMSMEFLPGRSLRNHLYNLQLNDIFKDTLSNLGYDLDELCSFEPDAGLGNGGLGRLASAYMDALTSCEFPATGFSIRYDYGIFEQKLVNGWQMEMPDNWLENGGVWLSPRTEETFEVHFGGVLKENWEDGKLKVEHSKYYTVLAVPYDMNVSGYNSKAVNKLRLWSAKSPTDFDMELFSKGEYVKAMENKAIAETISKVLYPADEHIEGKQLRLKQQYFFVSASIQSIIQKHLKHFGTIENLPDKISIHINDTHPALCVPELMRILLDDFGFTWDKAWDFTTKIISYTNHTVMAEALEKWPQDLFNNLLPRIYQIVSEINNRLCADLWHYFPNDWNNVAQCAVISNGNVNMANLCIAASHSINGVSALHSEILKNDVFKNFYIMDPTKFLNVTNGITHRRWLCEANPELADFIKGLIGDGFIQDATELSKLKKFKDDTSVLKEFRKIKLSNKTRLAAIIKDKTGVTVNPMSIFDIQCKRLHEYKRQLLNALNILNLYYKLKENPGLNINPRTFIFGAKAAPSYTMAKKIIRLIYMLGEVINNDKSINDKLKVIFLENYRVSLAESIIPAADVSEQISVAGKEASGTGNMKFMINGAVTIGTMDGANIEIYENVGEENIFIFGLLSDQIQKLYREGYNPLDYYKNNAEIKNLLDSLKQGIGGVDFHEITDSLIGGWGVSDPYMVLADFESYSKRQGDIDKAFDDAISFGKKGLMNIAGSGFFAADRSVKEYADRIWHLKTLKNIKVN